MVAQKLQHFEKFYSRFLDLPNENLCSVFAKIKSGYRRRFVIHLIKKYPDRELLSQLPVSRICRHNPKMYLQEKQAYTYILIISYFVTVFFICFFPYHVFALWFFFNPNMESEYDDFWHALKIIGFCLR